MMQFAGRNAPSIPRFPRSPVRSIVAAHGCLLLSLYWLEARTAIGLFGGCLLLAQVALLLVWIFLSTARVSGRLLGAVLLLVAGMLLSQLVGWVLVIVALPLAAARVAGLKLVRFPPDKVPLSRPMQFTIRQLAAAIFVTAVLFSVGQVALLLDTRLDGALMGYVVTACAFVSLGVLGVACAAIILTIPHACIWIVLRPGRVSPRLALAVIAWLVAGGLGFHLSNRMVSDRAAMLEITYATAWVTAAAVILLTTLAVLRKSGYRVVWSADSITGRAKEIVLILIAMVRRLGQLVVAATDRSDAGTGESDVESRNSLADHHGKAAHNGSRTET